MVPVILIASLKYMVFKKCPVLIELLDFNALQSARLIVCVTETVFVCLQTSSKPGPALEDGKAVGTVSSPLQTFEQRVKKRRGGGEAGAFVSIPSLFITCCFLLCSPTKASP